LYSYLQYISVYENNIRYVNKQDINFSKLAEKFGLTRQTVSTKFKNLKEMGLIKERNDKSYEIIVLEDNVATLVPYNTLGLLVNALSENAISTYVYLLKLYWANN
jgi:DNA-binding transcriptional ArsR family regulator